MLIDAIQFLKLDTKVKLRYQKQIFRTNGISIVSAYCRRIDTESGGEILTHDFANLSEILWWV